MGKKRQILKNCGRVATVLTLIRPLKRTTVRHKVKNIKHIKQFQASHKPLIYISKNITHEMALSRMSPFNSTAAEAAADNVQQTPQ